LGAPAFPKAVQLVESERCLTSSGWEGARRPAARPSWCCVAARAVALPARLGLSPVPGHRWCCAGFAPCLVPLWQRSPLSFFQLWPVCSAAQPVSPAQGAPLPVHGLVPRPQMRVPPLHWWLGCLPCPSTAATRLCQLAWDGVCCVSASVPLLCWGSSECWSTWETRGLSPCCLPIGESVSELTMPALGEFMGFFSVALSLFIKQGTWQVCLLIQEICRLVSGNRVLEASPAN